MRAMMMQVQPPSGHWSLVASALLHIALCILLIIYVHAPKDVQTVSAGSVAVELISIPALTRSEPSPADQLPSTRAVPAGPAWTRLAPERRERSSDVQLPEPPASSHPTVRPSQMLSDQVLSDPRSKNVRRELAALLPADQVEQLCGLEAMAQVGEWSQELKPDRIVAYAMSDPRMKGGVFTADGAAFHSDDDWYQIQFKCSLSADHQTVVAFEFTVGNPIPKSEWADHNLPDEDKSMD